MIIVSQNMTENKNDNLVNKGKAELGNISIT